MNHEIPNRFLNVHQVLQNAVLTTSEEAPMRSFTFRVDSGDCQKAMHICKVNGTDLSTFLRGCCSTLILDYQQPPTE